VEEYYIYNPDTNSFEIWIRSDNSLDSITELHNWISPRLGIRFDLSTDGLQIFRPDGTKFYSYLEVNQLLEQESHRTEQANQRAEQESHRAEQATQQLAEMAEQLKQYRDRFGELPS
jgi:hypothetical protein